MTQSVRELLFGSRRRGARLFGGSGSIGRRILINSTVITIRLGQDGVEGKGTRLGTGSQ